MTVAEHHVEPTLMLVNMAAARNAELTKSFGIRRPR